MLCTYTGEGMVIQIRPCLSARLSTPMFARIA